jgi:alkanesulfonate monooxygenase SsuD/methylene tetrahydromethanopterin reductase-like flavin-dependent oxidoreductase (luciferase family)
MIDMISKGRLVSGFVRGGGQEQLATGVNPAFNRERFEEAHDLIAKTWTRPARSAGRARITSTASSTRGRCRCRSRIRACGSRACCRRRRYLDRATALSLYRAEHRDRCDQGDLGYVFEGSGRGWLHRGAGEFRLPDPRARAGHDEKALRNARQFMWMQGEFTGLAHPVWANPSGYFSPSGRRAFVEFAVGRAKNPRGNPTFEDQIESTMIIAGTPDTVIPQLKTLIEHTRPGIMGIWGNDGTVPKEDRRRCIELLVKEVMPAVREHGKTLGLKDPWEANAPVHLKYSTDIPVQRAAAE